MQRPDRDKSLEPETAESPNALPKGPTAPPPGSLTSLRIRRRAVNAQRPAAPERSAPTPPAPQPTEPADAPGQSAAAPERGHPRGEQGPPAETRPAPQAARPAPVVRKPQDIVTYWTHLRGARRFPSTADLDDERIAADWPNTILIRCRSGSRVLEPDRVFSGSGSSQLSGLGQRARVNLSPMMLQWLLGLAGEVVREGRPMADDETFPALSRTVRYRAVALPFSDDQAGVDHVLCHVSSEA